MRKIEARRRSLGKKNYYPVRDVPLWANRLKSVDRPPQSKHSTKHIFLPKNPMEIPMEIIRAVGGLWADCGPNERADFTGFFESDLDSARRWIMVIPEGPTP